jgi:phage host-nuclease inhibitor protein Gam
MSRHAPPPEAAPAGDAPRRLAQLRQLLLLVGEIAGRPPARNGDRDLDEAARIGAAYAAALPILQRRVDALVSETSAWAAAGVDALTRGGTPAAAARLADELAAAIEDVLKLLRL